jgi:predicted transcriptional regulator
MPKDAKDIKQMFLQKKPCSILLAIPKLEKPYVSLLMKEADTTFAHTTNILSEMEAYGLITFASEGRTKYVKLTVIGKDLAKSLRSVDSLLDGKSVIKKLSSLEKRLDRIQEDIRSGRQDEKAVASRGKKLKAIIERTRVIEAEASRYNNEAISLAIARAKERIEYFKTKVQPMETIPQDTLNQWPDNN